MKKGEVKVTLPKKYHSTLDTKITMTTKAKKEIEKLRRDRQKIISYFESKKIK